MIIIADERNAASSKAIRLVRSPPVSFSSVVAGLLWLLHLATVASLGHSDAAGNAIGEAYAAIQVIALWALLAIMTVIAGIKGTAPKTGKDRGAGHRSRLRFGGDGCGGFAGAGVYLSPFLWPIIIPALVPPLLAAWCFLALSASKLRRETANMTAGVLPGAMLVVCATDLAAIVGAQGGLRAGGRTAEKIRRGSRRACRLTLPLWAWTPFLDTPTIPSVQRCSTAFTASTNASPRRRPCWIAAIFRLRISGRSISIQPGIVREGAQPAAQAGRAAGAGNARIQSLIRDIAVQVSDAVSGMELAGRLWLFVRRGNRRRGKAWPRDTATSISTSIVWPNCAIRGKLGKILRERPERFSMLNGSRT